MIEDPDWIFELKVLFCYWVFFTAFVTRRKCRAKPNLIQYRIPIAENASELELIYAPAWGFGRGWIQWQVKKTVEPRDYDGEIHAPGQSMDFTTNRSNFFESWLSYHSFHKAKKIEAANRAANVHQSQKLTRSRGISGLNKETDRLASGVDRERS